MSSRAAHGGASVAYGTVLDSGYILRALALYYSFASHVRSGTFHFFCVDAAAAETLQQLHLERAHIVAAEDFVSERLEAARVRLRVPEFCWSCKPLVVGNLLASQPTITWAVYLDADMAFFSDPVHVFPADPRVFGLLTPHHFTADFKHWESQIGTRNGGFAAFRRSPETLAVLDWWLHACLARPDLHERRGETFDQKIFDQMGADHYGIQDASDIGVNAAPWNIAGRRIVTEKGLSFVDGHALALYHFQGLKVLHPRLVDLYAASWKMPRSVKRSIYEPYVALLRRAQRQLAAEAPDHLPSVDRFNKSPRALAGALKEALLGRRHFRLLRP